MANRFARKNGNWTDSDMWSDTATGTADSQFLPTASDIAYCNNFVIDINSSVVASEIRVAAENGATLGGNINLLDGATLNSNILGTYSSSLPSGHAHLKYAGTGSATINGNITGTSYYGKQIVLHTGTGTINFNGNITGSGSGDLGYVQNAGTLNFVGDIYTNSITGITVAYSAVCNITGSLNSTSSNICVNARYGATVTITGDMEPTSGKMVVLGTSCSLTVNGDLNPNTLYTGTYPIISMDQYTSKAIINGDVYAGATYGLIAGKGNVVINGDVIGLSGSNSKYAISADEMSIEINGELLHNDTAIPIIQFIDSGYLKINNLQPIVPSSLVPLIFNQRDRAAIILNGPLNKIDNTSLSVVYGNYNFPDITDENAYEEFYINNVKKKFRAKSKLLTNANLPPIDKVLKGTIYGFNNEFIGTKDISIENLIAKSHITLTDLESLSNG